MTLFAHRLTPVTSGARRLTKAPAGAGFTQPCIEREPKGIVFAWGPETDNFLEWTGDGKNE